jgi:serine/threonine protein kinase
VGTPDYVAPEVLKKQPHGAPVDWWALGVIIYEFTTGCPPFNDEDVQGVFRNILGRRIDWPDEEDMEPACRDLIEKLLVLDPAKRITVKEVKAHPYFAGIVWDRYALERAHGGGVVFFVFTFTHNI